MLVSNMISNRSGRAVANQYVIHAGDVTIFQSYDSEIVSIDRETKTITVFPEYNYSRTTAKYRAAFMRDMGILSMISTKDFEKAMKDCEIPEGFTIVTVKS